MKTTKLTLYIDVRQKAGNSVGVLKILVTPYTEYPREPFLPWLVQMIFKKERFGKVKERALLIIDSK
jgi:hypothetical protein